VSVLLRLVLVVSQLKDSLPSKPKKTPTEGEKSKKSLENSIRAVNKLVSDCTAMEDTIATNRIAAAMEPLLIKLSGVRCRQVLEDLGKTMELATQKEMPAEHFGLVKEKKKLVDQLLKEPLLPHLVANQFSGKPGLHTRAPRLSRPDCERLRNRLCGISCNPAVSPSSRAGYRET